MATNGTPPLSRNVKRLGHLDMPGGGQVVVQGDYAFLGHMAAPHGTTIVDVSDPARPKVVSRIELTDPAAHSHKARVVGDVMVVNHEQVNRNQMRKGQDIPRVTGELKREVGRAPTEAEVAERLGVGAADLPKLREAAASGFADGGFKIYDVADKAEPRLIHHEKTHGVGVHRFYMDERYAYISTEKEGYRGNVLVIYDMARPEQPEEVSTWWMAGQHVAGGETPHWHGTEHRLHHALRHGDRMYAACWQGGLAIVDVRDITRPATLATHTYHPPVRTPTHTVMPLPERVGGREVALVVDEELGFLPGQPHACLWVYDISDLSNLRPLAAFHVGESESPFAGAGYRFGAHQFQEHAQGTLAFVTWFGGGLRIVDVRNPLQPVEVGHFIPEPVGGQKAPESNDVEVDARGLVYLLDRQNGFDILEFNG